MGERLLAAFVGIEVSEDLWPAAVEWCGLSEMREEARSAGRIDMVFENGALATGSRPHEPRTAPLRAGRRSR